MLPLLTTRWALDESGLGAGAKVNVCDTMAGWTPLILAAFMGDSVNVRGLLAARADIDAMAGAKDGCGTTPLIAAASGAHGIPEAAQYDTVKVKLRGAERPMVYATFVWGRLSVSPLKNPDALRSFRDSFREIM